jgi:hypothetical protein
VTLRNVLVGVVVLLAAAGCTGASSASRTSAAPSATAGSPTTTAVRTGTSTAVPPPSPTPGRSPVSGEQWPQQVTGTTTCGYVLGVRFPRGGGEYLGNCATQMNSEWAVSMTLTVGQSIEMWHQEQTPVSFASTDGSVLGQSGEVFTARRPGTSTVTATYQFCFPTRTCDAVKVRVVG